MPISRITYSSNQLQIRDNLLLVQQQYQAATVPATTGRRLNNLSDDASNTSRLFSLRAQVKDNDQYQRNITNLNLKLNFTDTRLSETYDSLQRVRDVAVQGIDPTLTTSTITQINNQLDDFKSEIMGYANAKFENKYIFSGTATETQPFSGVPVTFHGNSNIVSVQASQTVQIKTNVDGDTTFTGAGGGVNIFTVIDNLKTAIGARDSAGISSSIQDLDTALSQVGIARSAIGIRIQQSSAIQGSLSDDRVNAMDKLSGIQDASMDQAFSDLISKETAMRLVYASSSKVLSLLGQISLQV